MRRVLSAALIWWALQAGPELDWSEGRREQALAAWSEQLAQRPQDAELRVRLARAHMAVHRNAAALAVLAALGAEVDPLRGIALFRLGRFEEALGKLARDGGEPLLMRIDAFEALARFAEADAEIARLAQVLGDDDPRVTTARGRALVRGGDLSGAIEQFRLSLARDACDVEALFGLGSALVRTGSRDEGARVLAEHRRITPLIDQLDFAERSVDLAPAHAPNHAAVGDAERALGRIDRADRAYARAAELARDEDVVAIALRRARLFAEDRRDLERALAVLDEAAVRRPDARLFVRSGDLLAAAKRSSEARARYESARKLRPDDPEIARRIAALGETQR